MQPDEYTADLLVASQYGDNEYVRNLLSAGAEVNAVDFSFRRRTALIQASQQGMYTTVQLLLRHGANPNIADEEGCTALTMASQMGHTATVKLLLRCGALVDWRMNNGRTGLQQAATTGQCDTVRELLSAGADVNAHDDIQDRTALIHASEEGHYETVLVLLENNADVNFADRECCTSLIVASESGHGQIVRLLLENSAQVDATMRSGRSALTQACQNGRLTALEQLLRHSANVNRPDTRGITGIFLASQQGHKDTVQLLLSNGAQVNACSKEGVTPLFQASKKGYGHIVQLLLEYGASANHVTNTGETSLMYASCFGHREVGVALLENGARVNDTSDSGRTALFYACQNGHLAVVRTLLDHGADPSIPDERGVTSLALAGEEGNADIIKALLDKGANLAAQHRGRHPVIQAAQSGNVRAVEALLNCGADPDVADIIGVTGLIIASHEGHTSTVKLLLQRGATINNAMLDSSTALTHATENGHCDTVRELLQHGALVNLGGVRGTTPALYASERRLWDILEVLIEAGADLSQANTEGITTVMYLCLTAVSAESKMMQILEGSLVAEDSTCDTLQHCDYFISYLAFMLLGSLIQNKPIPKQFHCLFRQVFENNLAGDYLYAFLSKGFVHDVETTDSIFPPYQGLEGKISLHTLGTAVLCTLPVSPWSHLTQKSHLLNMLHQSPMHMLAFETQCCLEDLEQKIQTAMQLGFTFMDCDSNGRVPYHLACLCSNGTYLLCALKLDQNIRHSFETVDNLGRSPLDYLIYVNATPLSSKPLLGLLVTGLDIELTHQQWLQLTDAGDYEYEESWAKLQKVYEAFKPQMQTTNLQKLTETFPQIDFRNEDIRRIFQDPQIGLTDLKQSFNQQTIIAVMDLLQVIGTEMGKIDSLFECTPGIKGSIQENAKCGIMDELDTSMKLVNAADLLKVNLETEESQTFCDLKSICQRYLKFQGSEQFDSISFCADFWLLFLLAIDSEAVRSLLARRKIVLENCKRKNGFVGMVNISCLCGPSWCTISVDVAPCIENAELDDYIALLRPRHYENKLLGTEFQRGLELSSSLKDWNLLQYFPEEVMLGYTLVKILRSVTKSFQTADGDILTAEDMLPSYLIKSALLWILDEFSEHKPVEIGDNMQPVFNAEAFGKFGAVYADVSKTDLFQQEAVTSYSPGVLDLCLKLMEHSSCAGDTSCVVNDIVKEHAFPEAAKPFLTGRINSQLVAIITKCSATSGYLSWQERILPYILMARLNRSHGYIQNGINLQRMRGNMYELMLSPPYLNYPPQDRLLHSTIDDVIYSRKTHCKPWSPLTRPPPNSTRHPAVAGSGRQLTPDLAGKARLWALRILHLLPVLLNHRHGVRNYYLAGQDIRARDAELASSLCHVFEALLQ